MQFFISGTGTDIGKTLVTSWLCAHSNYTYFKPIQTGAIHGTDSQTVAKFSKNKIHKECYVFKNPFSPQLAAQLENTSIDIKKIHLPKSDALLVEGAGGLLVPINHNCYIIDLIKQLKLPVILVATTKLGTINHTLLSLEALRYRAIPICGVIMSGDYNLDNSAAIARYGQVEILGNLPYLKNITRSALLNIPLPNKLKKILEV